MVWTHYEGICWAPYKEEMRLQKEIEILVLKPLKLEIHVNYV
jgi:hypothetical protein